MTTERLFPSGDWLITDIINGYLVRRRYSGYTKREAEKLFKAEVKKK